MSRGQGPQANTEIEVRSMGFDVVFIKVPSMPLFSFILIPSYSVAECSFRCLVNVVMRCQRIVIE